jgi:cytochrome oxidase Cu insertion factor (SCO1/SenC/PrrC family)
VTAALLIAATLAAVPAGAAAGEVGPADLPYTYGVGPFRPRYTAPPPGSYELPPIDEVHDHPLVDTDGRPTTLFTLTGDRVAVVAFVYTSCPDATGCPLSMAVLRRVDRALAKDPALARRVVLLSVSFDPERDTPAQMAKVRALHAPKSDWRFTTTADEAALAPLLADFGQPVAKLRLPDGTWSGFYRHVLKVFLVDTRHRVRNVYSTGFLDDALVLNDVRTVLGEATQAGSATGR